MGALSVKCTLLLQSQVTPDRVFVVSDVHCDYTLNQDWLEQLKQKDFGYI